MCYLFIRQTFKKNIYYVQSTVSDLKENMAEYISPLLKIL